MNYSETFSIQLTIDSKTYSIEVNRDTEIIYRQAAKLINAKMQTYINSFPDLEKTDYMAMSMLDIAVSYIKENNVDSKLQEMIKSIDKSMPIQ